MKNDDPDDDVLSSAAIKQLKSARRKAKKDLKTIDASLLAAARQTLDAMPMSHAPIQAISVLRDRNRDARRRALHRRRAQHACLVRQHHRQVWRHTLRS